MGLLMWGGKKTIKAWHYQMYEGKQNIKERKITEHLKKKAHIIFAVSQNYQDFKHILPNLKHPWKTVGFKFTKSKNKTLNSQALAKKTFSLE